MIGAAIGGARERRLLKRYRALTAVDRDTLEAFADFLAQRQQNHENLTSLDEPIAPPHPPQERVTNERVIDAMKRLRRTYPRLDATELLDEASLLMSAHLLQGQPAAEVIDALEALFARHAAAPLSKAPELR